jgi:hypothetical protein
MTRHSHLVALTFLGELVPQISQQITQLAAHRAGLKATLQRRLHGAKGPWAAHGRSTKISDASRARERAA